MKETNIEQLWTTFSLFNSKDDLEPAFGALIKTELKPPGDMGPLGSWREV